MKRLTSELSNLIEEFVELRWLEWVISYFNFVLRFLYWLINLILFHNNLYQIWDILSVISILMEQN